MKWHYYVRDDNTAYWSMQPPHVTKDKYLAYIYATEQPKDSPFQFPQHQIINPRPPS